MDFPAGPQQLPLSSPCSRQSHHRSNLWHIRDRPSSSRPPLHGRQIKETWRLRACGGL